MDLSVTRGIGGLVIPSEPTPMETLDLSRIDRLPMLRCNARTIHVFGNAAGISTIIRDALSKALVPYYPLAGRLKHSEDGQLLQVACCGEGVWFVEAFANCKLEHVAYFEDVTSIPFDKLLPPPLPQDQSDDPLVLMQVTEFQGDGFVMGLTFCHSICDGLGAAQFLNAVAEFARGLPNLTVPPLWHRHFLPQKQHQTPMPMPPAGLGPVDYQLEQANIDIPLDCINKHKIKLNCSAFELIAATLWKHRTHAIQNLNQLVKLVFFANCRELLNPPLPKGFYGNCFFPVTVTASSEEVMSWSISDVVKLIKEAKLRLPIEFDKWSKFMNEEEKEDPFLPPLGYTTLFISEWGRLGFNQVDYGEGTPRQVVPMQGSSIIPVVIVGSMPYPKKGMRLMTWCVDKPHLKPFLHNMSTTFTTSHHH